MTGSQALSAGWTLIVSTALCAFLGYLAGNSIDFAFVFSLAGGIIGVGVGFIVIYKRYVVPANEEDANRDYSKIIKYDVKNTFDDEWDD